MFAVVEHRIGHVDHPLLLVLIEVGREFGAELVQECTRRLQPLVAHEIVAPAAHLVLELLGPRLEVVGLAEPHDAEREDPVDGTLHHRAGFFGMVPVELGPEVAVAHVEAFLEIDLAQRPAVRRVHAMEFEILGPVQAGPIQHRLHDDELDVIANRHLHDRPGPDELDVVVECARMHIYAEAFGEKALVISMTYFVQDRRADSDLRADIRRRRVGRAGPSQYADLADGSDFRGLGEDLLQPRGQLVHALEQVAPFDPLQNSGL